MASSAGTPTRGAGSRPVRSRHGGLGNPPLRPVGLALAWPPTSGSGSHPSTCCARRGSACASASGWAWTRTTWPTLYDVSILTYVGCPVYGNEAALLFGDDIDFRAHAVEVDLAGFPAMMFMLRRAGHGTSAFNRARQAASAHGRAGVAKWSSKWRTTARRPARSPTRLGLGDDVRAGVEQAYARWDGQGVPDDLSGTGVSLAARDLARGRSVRGLPAHGGDRCGASTWSARAAAPTSIPRSPRSWRRIRESLFDDLDRDTVDELLAAEPVERPPLTDDELDRALEAIGDFCDLRCPFFAGHARGTADLVRGAADVDADARSRRGLWPTAPRSCTTSDGSGCPDRCGASPDR